MQMNVEHRLPRIRTTIHGDAIAVFRIPSIRRNFLRCQKQLAHQRCIFRLNVIDGSNVLTRNNQYMQRCLRVNVVESQHIVVFIGNFCRDLTCHNAAEQTVAHQYFLRPSKAWERVPLSTYSSSLPMGTPCAIRDAGMPRLAASSLM